MSTKNEGYSTQRDYMNWVKASTKQRSTKIERALREAFSDFIELRKVEVVIFSSIGVKELAHAIVKHPLILKPLLAICNIGGRAVERDLGLKNVNTYQPKLTEQEANIIAGYLKVFLPPYIELPSLVYIDQTEFVDKEVRLLKGRWERVVLNALNQLSGRVFKKRKFNFKGELFEVDAATPPAGSIRIGVDIKRIEARRDIHKRCDEIVNKAINFKKAYPKTKFAVVIYYPFVTEHINIQNRLQSSNIDAVVFAAESKDSIKSSVKLLLAKFGASK